jgi:hypothetical protein
MVRDHLENLCLDRRIILKWIFRSGMWGMKWIGLAQNRDVAGNCECGYEPLVSIKCGEFLDYLRNCLLLGKDSPLCSYLDTLCPLVNICRRMYE